MTTIQEDPLPVAEAGPKPVTALGLKDCVQQIREALGSMASQVDWLAELANGHKQKVSLLLASFELVEEHREPQDIGDFVDGLEDEVMLKLRLSVTGPQRQRELLCQSGERFAAFTYEGKTLIVEQELDSFSTAPDATTNAGDAGTDPKEITMNATTNAAPAATAAPTTGNAGSGVSLEAIMASLQAIQAAQGAGDGKIAAIAGVVDDVRKHVVDHGNALAGLGQRVTTLAAGQATLTSRLDAGELKVKELDEKLAKASALAGDAMAKATAKADKPSSQGLFGQISDSFSEDPVGSLLTAGVIGACASKVITGRWNPFADSTS